jgi:cadmium resistance protein CadD (predicted permease)
MQRLLLVITLILFGILSAAAVWQHGLLGIFAPIFQSLAAAQIFVDLLIALTLVMLWIWHDARAIGRNPWIWIVATLATGSFGPLIYLLTRKPLARKS